MVKIEVDFAQWKGNHMSGGSKATVELAQKHGKPVLHLYKSLGMSDVELGLRRFIKNHNIATLNVAGPRDSEAPEIGAFVKEAPDRTWPLK